jgi:hypothetical protein
MIAEKSNQITLVLALLHPVPPDLALDLLLVNLLARLLADPPR